MRRPLLLLFSLFLVSCSSFTEIVTADNVLRAIEIGENARAIWKDGSAIYETIQKPPSVEPIK
jgi:uncharacterized protein YcfL